jgi:hypothetical protein
VTTGVVRTEDDLAALSTDAAPRRAVDARPAGRARRGRRGDSVEAARDDDRRRRQDRRNGKQQPAILHASIIP